LARDGEEAFPGTGQLKAEDELIRQLKRENEILRQESATRPITSGLLKPSFDNLLDALQEVLRVLISGVQGLQGIPDPSNRLVLRQAGGRLYCSLASRL